MKITENKYEPKSELNTQKSKIRSNPKGQIMCDYVLVNFLRHIE